jgi:hypothetical protein
MAPTSDLNPSGYRLSSGSLVGVDVVVGVGVLVARAVGVFVAVTVGVDVLAVPGVDVGVTSLSSPQAKINEPIRTIQGVALNICPRRGRFGLPG